MVGGFAVQVLQLAARAADTAKIMFDRHGGNHVSALALRRWTV